jgi:hypothetical protein
VDSYRLLDREMLRLLCRLYEPGGKMGKRECKICVIKV